MVRTLGIAICCISLISAVSGCGGSSPAVQPPPTLPAFSISSVSPANAVPGSADLLVSVTGSKFENGASNRSNVVWSANAVTNALSTTFINSKQLIGVIPASLLKDAVHAQMYVENLDTNGAVNAKTNAVNFDVVAPSPGKLTISSISPNSVVAGNSDLTLTFTGSSLDMVHAGGHPTHTDVEWCGVGTCSSLSASVISPTQLTAVVTADLLASPATVSVSIWKWYFADDTPFAESNSLTFVVTAGNTATISPSADTIGPNGMRQFTASLGGNPSPAKWAILEGEGGGSITPSGLYTAPPTTGMFHVVATPDASPSESVVATVAVVKSGFAPTGSMHSARSGHRAVLLVDGRVLVVGSDGTAELFDPASGTFSVTGAMTTSRYGATFTLLANGKVLVAGGYGPGTSQLPRLPSAELYDPQTGTFTLTGSMRVGRILHTATLLKDGRVLIAGGTDRSGGGGGATASAELFDPATETFSSTGSMNTDRANHSATLLPSGQVLIAGGWNGHAADSADDPPWDPLFTELFDPSSGTFKYSANMSTTRIGHTATKLSDGKVLLLGGISALQNIHNQPIGVRYAEIFDPTTQTIAGLDDLTISRDGYTVTLLPSGEILLVGGKIQDVAVSMAELLSPATGLLGATGGLSIPRVGHTATLLKDSRVLVTGGTDAIGNELASAELYK